MSIRLRELFACTEQGGAFVAEFADGRLLHIGEVPSGLACNCVCPGCGRRMVAKKGDVQAHHFAHNAQQDGRSCASAGETALHKFAKLILDERLEITLPAQVVEEQKDREVVVRAAKRTFDRAILETKDGQIVPDVVLLLRDRRLIVEFKVTHPCDLIKIARIQAMDVGAIEIDLSQYRDHKLSEIGDRILYDAPRTWLHNPREREARARLEVRALQRAEERRTQIENYRGSYRHRSPSESPEAGHANLRPGKTASPTSSICRYMGLVASQWPLRNGKRLFWKHCSLQRKRLSELEMGSRHSEADDGSTYRLLTFRTKSYVGCERPGFRSTPPSRPSKHI